MIKILWLSDFHFSPMYTKQWNNALNKYLNSFYASLKENCNDITHVVLSGDIAGSGESDEYLSFINDFFVHFVRFLPPDVKYLIIPGNHDIEWAQYSSLYSAFTKLFPIEVDSFSKFFSYNEEKINFLEQNADKILRNYNTFLTQIKKHCEDNNYGKVYSESFYDEEYEAMFILINSALNSFGDIPRSSISGDLQKDILRYGYEGALNEVINNISDFTSGH